MNYDTTYNIQEHNLQIVVDEAGDIFINMKKSNGITTEVCAMDRKQVFALREILGKAIENSLAVQNGN
jgi:hypothetical protein